MRRRVVLGLCGLMLSACGGDGADGANGAAGQVSLVDLVEEAPGGDCPQGGVAIHSGLDADGDGTLSEDEVLQTRFACHGAEGQDGDDGDACSAVRDDEAGTTTVTCPGDDPVVIRDGDDGPNGQDGQDGQDGDNGQDGQPCAVERDDEAGTTTVTCPGSEPVVIEDGQDGQDGQDGDNGQDGQDGQDAQPCTVVRDEDAGTTTVTCPGSEPVVIPDAGGEVGAPAFTVDFDLPFDLDTGRIGGPRPDITFSQPDPEQPVVLRGLVEARVARLVPAVFGALSIEDLARARFEEGVSLVTEAVDDEQGAVVILVHTGDGRLFKLGRFGPVDGQSFGFDFEPVPFDLPPLQVEAFEPIDLESGGANFENPDRNDISLQVDDQVRGLVSVMPAGPGVTIARVQPARFAQFSGEEVNFAAFEESPAPLYPLEFEEGGVVVLVRTTEGNIFKLGAVFGLAETGFAVEAARLDVTEPGVLIRSGANLDLDTGLVDGPVEETEIAFDFSEDQLFGVRGEQGVQMARLDRAFVDESDLAGAEFVDFNLDLAPFEDAPGAVLVRTARGHLFEITGLRIFAARGEALLGVDVERLPIVLPEVEVDFDRLFDLETLSHENGPPDISIAPAQFGQPIRLQPSPGVDLARLHPAFFDLVDAEDVAGANFSGQEVSLEPIFDEVGPIVVLVRTAEGNVFALAPRFATSTGTYGLDLRPIP